MGRWRLLRSEFRRLRPERRLGWEHPEAEELRLPEPRGFWGPLGLREPEPKKCQARRPRRELLERQC